MNSHFGRAVTVSLLTLIATSPIRSAESASSLTIAGPKVVIAGSELKITVTLKNTSGRAVGVTNHAPGGIGQEGLYVEVRDSHGNLAPMKEHYRQMQKGGEDGSFFTFTIAPGATNVSSVAIDSLYDLLKPGKYSIWVQREFGADTVRSNTIVVRVRK